MIKDLPTWINLLFLLTAALTLALFYYANRKPKKLLIVILLWSVLQSIIAYSGFYTAVDDL